MNILVCLKLISQASFSDAFGLSSDGEDRLSEGSLTVNPADRSALEYALQLRDQLPELTITVITMGPKNAEPMLRDAMAVGADQAVHICDPIFAGSDTIATTDALAAAIRTLPTQDLILCGVKSMDSETGHIGPQLAAALRIPLFSQVLALWAENGALRFRRAEEKGNAVGTLRLPALLTVVNSTMPFRLPSIRGLRKSRDAQIRMLSGADLQLTAETAGEKASGTETIRVLENRFAKRSGRRETELSRGVREIADLLAPFLGSTVVPAREAPAMPCFPEPAPGQKELWVVCGELGETELGLIKKGGELAAERGLALQVLSFSEQLPEEQPGVRERLAAMAERRKPEAILFERTPFFCDVAPAFAYELKRGITADCTELRWDDEYGLLQIRPTFGGRRIAVNRSLAPPYIATVRRGVFSAGGLLRLSGESLDSASLVISGGLGLGGGKNLAALEELAVLTGAALGASRAAVSAGFAPYSRQVGQTGVTVRPSLYLAFGISGAVQHLSGIMEAGKIVAVNADPEAPIHQYADYSLIADAGSALELLCAELRSRGCNRQREADNGA